MDNGPDFDWWREKARAYLLEGIPPEQTDWEEAPRLFLDTPGSGRKPVSRPVASAEFLELAQNVACARNPERWALLYRLIYRLQHENPNLLHIQVDADVSKAFNLDKSVRRDIHKMHAFVRFKKHEVDGQDTYIAWHRPEHLILKQAAAFFVRRFGDKAWSIFTPDLSAHWNLKELFFTEGCAQHEVETRDPFDEVWKTYYRSIFNPARLKIKAMRAEMPPKYWESLPEAEIIRDLIRESPERLNQMSQEIRYQAKPPTNVSWDVLRDAALSCLSCPLAEKAQRTVFGDGNLSAKMMIVGEQPGDEEDRVGLPFQGPAGQLLDQALAAAGLQRSDLYLTNAVKHFKWTGTEKARVHKRASGAEMHACKPWLEAEIQGIRPRLILALGVTASTALFGRLVKIQDERGRVFTDLHYAPWMLVSWHPAAILRSFSEDEKRKRFADLVSDLRQAKDLLS